MRPGEREVWERADALLAELLERPPGDRSRELERLSPEDPVASRLAELLAAAESPGGRLDREPDWTKVAPAREENAASTLVGRRFGAYVLDEEIGRGGMAVVYSAHRDDGTFEQRVAVKILGGGLLPTSAATRFRREQDLLARLRHPNIATLLDGGVADDGTPYLVMERIAGRPLDRYADEDGLDLRQRVSLLLQVAGAVAFAHRNLVVHRDLKPGNVLVTDAGEAKLLDFGIAKLLEANDDERTAAPSRLLTPAYAAPEQAEGGDVTTATDVYGLGRILEKLIRGLPVDADLVNIRARALHPDPDRRYADARAFAEDLGNWLGGRPVVATGDGLPYRLRKFLRRHRGAVGAAAALVGVGVSGLAATLWQAAEARREARTSATVNAFLIELFRASDPELAEGEDPRASELLRRGARRARIALAGEPRLEAELLHTIGAVQRELGQHDEAEASLARALDLRTATLSPLDPEIAATRVELALNRYELGRVDQAIAALKAALADLERSLPADADARLDAEVRLGDMLVVHGDYGEARTRMESVLSRLGVNRERLADLALDAEYTLGVALSELGDFDAAAERLRSVVNEERRRTHGFSRDLALYLNEYGLFLHDKPDYEAAEAAYREALDIKRKIYGDRHPQLVAGLQNLGLVLQDLGRPAEAVARLEESLAMARAIYGERHPQVAMALSALAATLNAQTRPAEARPLFEAALAIWRSMPDGPTEPERYANDLRNYGGLLFAAGELDAAEETLREALALYGRLETGDPVRPAVTRARLGEVEEARGRPAEAAALLGPALSELASTHVAGSPIYASLELALARAERALGRAPAADSRVAEVRSRLREGPAWDAVRSELARLDQLSR